MIRVNGNDSLSIVLVDFGVAQLFHKPATYLHLTYSTNHPVVRTLPFMSINGQQGHMCSCCDDLESLVYTIIYLACSKLPWSHLSQGSKVVLKKKLSITVEELCKGLPAPFCKFVNCVHSLGFNKKLDYQYLYSILLECSEQTEANQPDKPLCCSTHSHVYSDSTAHV